MNAEWFIGDISDKSIQAHVKQNIPCTRLYLSFIKYVKDRYRLKELKLLDEQQFLSLTYHYKI